MTLNSLTSRWWRQHRGVNSSVGMTLILGKQLGLSGAAEFDYLELVMPSSRTPGCWVIRILGTIWCVFKFGLEKAHHRTIKTNCRPFDLKNELPGCLTGSIIIKIKIFSMCWAIPQSLTLLFRWWRYKNKRIRWRSIVWLLIDGSTVELIPQCGWHLFWENS